MSFVISSTFHYKTTEIAFTVKLHSNYGKTIIKQLENLLFLLTFNFDFKKTVNESNTTT